MSRIYLTRILKGLERIPNKRKQWEEDWKNDKVLQWIDVSFKGKTLFQSKQEYIFERYRNRKQEIETQVAIRKLQRLLSSKRYKEKVEKHFNKVLPKAQYNEKVEFVCDLLAKINDLRYKYTKQLIEQYTKEGRNVNNINTKNSIKYHVNKKIQQDIGYNPEELQDKSVNHIITILFPKFEPARRPSLAEQDADSWVFDKRDSELSPIERLQKQEPVKHVSTLMKIHELRSQKN